jgi:hypothetical protein
MNARIVLIVQIAGIFALSSPTPAEEIPRNEYLKYVPLGYSRLVQQTDESHALNLFGDTRDPGYRDVNPVDGIDDSRGDVLLSLAVRFAPYLVQNTTNIPINFDIYIENSEHFPLNIDTWEVSGEESRLIKSESIDFAVLGESGCQSSSDDVAGTVPAGETVDGALDDCKLLALLDQFTQGEEAEDPAIPPVRNRPELFSILYFDFPGEGPTSWEKGYKAEYEKTPEARRAKFPHSYVHPFLKKADTSRGNAPGYELVLQYWFFYPSNDGGNNHEGDWEHLNVLISPKSMVKEPLSAETIDLILTGQFSGTDDASDPLVIQRVDYYFHHFVMTVDFSNPNVYLPRDEWKTEVKSHPESRYREKEIWKAIRRMAYVDDEETIINTHPFGYIGADNKGIDQVMSMPGGKNRNSHGTYPFPGRYNSIGPAGATEQISLNVDSRRFAKRLEAGDETMGPEFKRGSVLGLADPDRLRIVPDWERIVEITRSDPTARRNWSWLILPINWGYPATKSPFAGIIEHTGTGNISPVGPAFSSGWNISGPAIGFRGYQPHIMPSIFPVGFHDSFRNDFGFFNLTLPILFNLPPADFLVRIAVHPLKLALERPDPLYYPKDGLPARFVSLSTGISIQYLDDDHKALAFNTDQFESFVSDVILHFLENGADSTTSIIRGEYFVDNSTTPFFQIAFYIGSRFASENTVRNGKSAIGFNVEFNNIPPYRYSADLNNWEYAGSIRYSLSSSRFQPFLKGGYGWSWYRLENVQINGIPLDPAESQWIHPGGFMPNVWHYGLGIEFIPWWRVGRNFDGVEIAMRIEYARYTQDLGLDLSEIPLSQLRLVFPTLGDIPGKDRVVCNNLMFGISISF